MNPSPCRNRERLALVLILLFAIVLLATILFPQSVAPTVLPVVAGWVALAVRSVYCQQRKG